MTNVNLKSQSRINMTCGFLEYHITLSKQKYFFSPLQKDEQPTLRKAWMDDSFDLFVGHKAFSPTSHITTNSQSLMFRLA